MKCTSSLTIYNSYDILQEWQQIAFVGDDIFVLDMSELEDIDTAGAQLLLALKKQSLETGKTIHMTGWREEVISFLYLIGCKQLLDLEGDSQ